MKPRGFLAASVVNGAFFYTLPLLVLIVIHLVTADAPAPLARLRLLWVELPGLILIAAIALAVGYELRAARRRITFVVEDYVFMDKVEAALADQGYRPIEADEPSWRATFRANRLTPEIVVQVRGQCAEVTGPYRQLTRLERALAGRIAIASDKLPWETTAKVQPPAPISAEERQAAAQLDALLAALKRGEDPYGNADKIVYLAPSLELSQVMRLRGELRSILASPEAYSQDVISNVGLLDASISKALDATIAQTAASLLAGKK